MSNNLDFGCVESGHPIFLYELTGFPESVARKVAVFFRDDGQRGWCALIGLVDGREFEIDYDDNAGNEAYAVLPFEERVDAIGLELMGGFRDEDWREDHGLTKADLGLD